jgi:hypothetical protein
VALNSAITSAYQSALGRSPDSPGLAAWQQSAANGASSSQIVNAISNSAEAKIVSLYRTYLGREPDPAGLASWMKAYNNGASIGQITNGFISSDEYKNCIRSRLVQITFLPICLR